jgi:cobalt-zinc-cadmium efflux system protein
LSHGHLHAHTSLGTHRSAANRASGARKLGLVLGVTAVYTVAEALGGWISGSLALLADAGHMMTDNLALALALVALWTARRPPDPARTYGYQRVEILAALVNSVALVVVSLLIFWEAWERFQTPQEVRSGLMAAVAAGGLLVNLFGAWVLHGREHGMNVRAAYLHILGDLLSSVGALVAAGLILAFGWVWVDPLVSVAIGAVIVYSSTRLVLDSLNVLMEGAPSHLDAREVQRSLLETPGVCEVHDLHLWSLSGGTPLLTAHLVIDHSLSSGEVLRQATRRLDERFGITHATLQIEPPDFNIITDISP